jgi:hypothetical protein
MQTEQLNRQTCRRRYHAVDLWGNMAFNMWVTGTSIYPHGISIVLQGWSMIFKVSKSNRLTYDNRWMQALSLISKNGSVESVFQEISQWFTASESDPSVYIPSTNV